MRVGGWRQAPVASFWETDPVPIVPEAGWAPGPVWTCGENLASTGISSPDRPPVASRHIFTTVTILTKAFLLDYAVQNMSLQLFKCIRISYLQTLSSWHICHECCAKSMRTPWKLCRTKRTWHFSDGSHFVNFHLRCNEWGHAAKEPTFNAKVYIYRKGFQKQDFLFFRISHCLVGSHSSFVNSNIFCTCLSVYFIAKSVS